MLNVSAFARYLFQFHKGTIRTVQQMLPISSQTGFNSIKVRLEPATTSSIFACAEFQFHKGTIRTCRVHRWPQRAFPFQFHKGTIRTTGRGAPITPPRRFQFHKGTIRTGSVYSEPCRRTWFQFHKGTIRTGNSFSRNGLLYLSFNSIKVRLELEPGTLVRLLGSEFQFHKGTIRTSRTALRLLPCCFVSIP